MKTLWLLGSLGLGAGLMYFMDPERGAARRERVRGYGEEYGRQADAHWNAIRQTLGQQAPAALAQTSIPSGLRRGLEAARHFQGEDTRLPLGLCLLGSMGLGAGLAYLLEPQGGPQRRAKLCEYARAYWRTAPSTPARPQEPPRAWRVFQGQATPQVDAHTRKPAQPQAWYAEPADYEGAVLYSDPFVSREEAEAWARTQQERQPSWRIVQGRDTSRVDPHTRQSAQPQAWYAEPADANESAVLASEPFVTREEAQAWADTQGKR